MTGIWNAQNGLGNGTFSQTAGTQYNLHEFRGENFGAVSQSLVSSGFTAQEAATVGRKYIDDAFRQSATRTTRNLRRLNSLLGLASTVMVTGILGTTALLFLLPVIPLGVVTGPVSALVLAWATRQARKMNVETIDSLNMQLAAADQGVGNLNAFDGNKRTYRRADANLARMMKRFPKPKPTP